MYKLNLCNSHPPHLQGQKSDFSSFLVKEVKFRPIEISQNVNSPYCQPYNSYNISSESLVLDQLIIPKFIFFLILITYLVDIVLIL